MTTPLIRDMDLIRELMLKIEGGDRIFNVLSHEVAAAIGVPTEEARTHEEAEKLRYHLDLLVKGGFIEVTDYIGGVTEVEAITWEGHDFLDSIRDPVVWAKTKDGIKSAGGFTFDLLKALAKGFIKKQVEERTGIAL